MIGYCLDKLFSFCMYFWEIKDKNPFCVDDEFIILIHSYGLNKSKQLPDTSKKVLEKSIALVNNFPNAKIVILGCNCPDIYSGKLERNLKICFLENNGISKRNIINSQKCVINTFEEIGVAVKFLGNAKGVLFVADWIQMRRIVLFCKKFFFINYGNISIQGLWSKEQPSIFQKNKFIWFVGNILSSFSALFGKRVLSKIKNFKHSV